MNKKPKILFITYPSVGDTNPVRPFIKHISQEFSVAVCTVDRFRDEFSKSVSVIEYPFSYDDLMGQFDANPLINSKNMLDFHDLTIVQTAPEIADFSPDIILYDSNVPWGQMLAEKSSAKKISYSCSFYRTPLAFLPGAFKKSAIAYWWEIAKVSQKYMFTDISTLAEMSYFMAPAHARKHVCFIPKIMQPHSFFVPNEIVYLPSPSNNVASHTKARDINQKPLVYLSLGTTIQNRQMLRQTIKRLRKKFRIVVAAGENIADLQDVQAEYVKIAEWVDQKAVLEKADAFITHGGMNSVLEAISAEVPMLCFPQAYDQFSNARKVEKIGVGRYGNSSWIQSGKAADVLRNLINDESVTEKLKNVSKKCDASGSLRQFTRLVE